MSDERFRPDGRTHRERMLAGDQYIFDDVDLLRESRRAADRPQGTLLTDGQMAATRRAATRGAGTLLTDGQMGGHARGGDVVDRWTDGGRHVRIRHPPPVSPWRIRHPAAANPRHHTCALAASRMRCALA
jgi:hypothetical protein